jgi:hypothetical protein
MAAKTTTAGGRDVTAELAYLTRALKAPTLVVDESVDHGCCYDVVAEDLAPSIWSSHMFVCSDPSC